MDCLSDQDANLTTTKRSYEQALLCEHLLNHSLERNVVATSRRASQSSIHCPHSPTKRRSVSFSRASSMLVDNTHIMSGSFPSLMSILGSEDSTVYRSGTIDDQTKLGQHALHFTNGNHRAESNHHAVPKQLQHRGSIHSLTSESTDSSPTTTSSTFDSPIISDSSPSSSPESASSIAPHTSFQSVMLSANSRHVAALVADKPSSQRQQQQQPSSPPEQHTRQSLSINTDSALSQEPKKNPKNLTLDMNAPALRRPATSSGAEGFQLFSAPTSPLKEPLRSARKKPTNLTIRTPGFQAVSFAQAMNGVPPTPSFQRPPLHAHSSSPSIASFASPTFAPAGGMHLPLPSVHSKQSSLSSHNYGSSYGSSQIHGIITGSLPDLREEEAIQLQKSQEEPERGYTEGPVRIYDSGVYLFLEPTAEEASNFDTVINVAKEIKNPFREKKAADQTVMSVWRKGHDQQTKDVPEPQTAVSEISFKSAVEWPQAEKHASPTTPTQSSFDQKEKEPEYFHVPWDHNSEILEDLYPLCHIIDERIAAGKKVLVHCQLGVSRSASLIIAYGLFKGYQPDFHQMYTAVKERSRWVGPNMSLIYQLMDFHSKVTKGEYSITSHPPKPQWLQRPSQCATTPTAATQENGTAVSATTANTSLNGASQPASASSEYRRSTPLRLNKELPPVPLFSKDIRTSNSNSTLRPANSPSSSSPTDPQSTPSPPPTTIKRAASRPLPLRERSPEMAIPEHRPRQLPSLKLERPSSIMDLAMNDVPETPSIFSPRATEFVASPFGIRGAGDLSVPGSRKSQCAPATFDWLPLRRDKHFRTASKDPRSPHQTDEPKGIFRTIDGLL